MSDNSPIVIDNRPDYIRAGLSSGDKPTVVFPTNSVTSKAPMGDDGIITDWDSMKAVWSHTFKQLGVDPSQHSLIISEPTLNPVTNREKMTEIFFDTFKIPKLYLARGELLALYDANRTTGCVVNLTGSSTFFAVVPCYEGYPQPNAIVLYYPTKDEPKDSHLAKLGEVVYDSIMKCDVDIRPQLYRNIILTGSTSQYPGIETILQKSVVGLVPPTLTIQVTEPTDPEMGAWRGGDKLVPVLDQYGSWMSMQEYQQYGATFVHRKCL